MRTLYKYIGESFNELTVVSTESGRCICKCNCGNIVKTSIGRLKNGRCGRCLDCSLKLKRKNISGQKFGNWVVLDEYIRRGKNNVISWKCKCICGAIKWINTCNLRDKKRKSCNNCNKILNQSKFYKRAIKKIKYTYVYSAKSRGLEWSISDKQLIKLIKSKCYYTGLPPLSKCRVHGSNIDFYYNGIDRIDNNKGYTVDNCVPCNSIVNIMKRDLSYDEFMKWCYILIENHEKKMDQNLLQNNLKVV